LAQDDGCGYSGDCGGAIKVDTGSVVAISNSTLQNNTAEFGGGVYNNGTLTIVSSDISSNTVTEDGGGIANRDQLTVTNSTVSNNVADSDGGGIALKNADIYIEDVDLNANTSTGTYGGGMYLYNSSFEIVDSRIYTNTGRHGGGLFNYISSGTIENSLIYDNYSTAGQGGGIDNQRSSISIINSTFSHNTAKNGRGGAIYNITGGSASSYITLTHTTVVSNTGNIGAGIYLGGGSLSQVWLQNSIVANNVNDDDCLAYTGSEIIDATAGYNIDSDGTCTTSGGTGNVTDDPLVLALADNGGNSWTHALDSGSPARDSIPEADCASARDQRGETRPQMGACDMGAVEVVYDCAASPFVAAIEAEIGYGIYCYNAAVSGSYTISITADIALTDNSTTIDNGSGAILNIAGNGQTVNGSDLYRPFTVDAGEVNFDDIIISQGLAQDDGCGYSGDCGGAIKVDTGSVVAISNSTLQNNTAEFGGGVYNNGTLTIVSSDISSNTVTEDGGGIANRDQLTVTNSTVSNNVADSDGGGIALKNADIYIEDVDLNANTSTGTYGGGMYLYNSSFEIVDSRIYTNTGRHGGGLFNYISSGTIENSLIYDNYSTAGQGGGIDNQRSSISIINSTFSHNTAKNGRGGAIYNITGGSASSYITLTHTTVVSNTGNIGAGIYLGGGSLSQVWLQNSIVANNVNDDDCLAYTGSEIIDATAGYNIDSDGTCTTSGGTGNVTDDPLVLALADNGGNSWTHALDSGSPARDSIPEADCASARDQRGETRPQMGACDMGAVEVVYDCAASPFVAAIEAEIGYGIYCYNAAVSGSYTISITADIALTDNSTTIDNGSGAILNIAGNGQTVNGSDLYRPFTVDAGELSFDNIIINQGLAQDDGCGYSGDCGGGIKIDTGSVVTISNSILQNNNADFGGGVYNKGVLTIVGSDISSNTVVEDGGGIANRNQLTVTNSTISNNVANSDGAGIALKNADIYMEDVDLNANTAKAWGGGLYLHNSSFEIIDSRIYTNTAAQGGGLVAYLKSGSIENSLIHDNYSTSGQGGGIDSENSEISITNSTLSHNSMGVGGRGGAIYNVSYGSSTAYITLTHTTIVSNTAGNGAGIYLSGGNSSYQSRNGMAYIGDYDLDFQRVATNTLVRLWLQNSIVANNISGDDCLADSGWEIIDATAGYNMDSDGTCTTSGGTGNVTDDPLVLALADNDDDTQTHALLSGSPAVDQIPSGTNGCGTTYTTDQRDEPRNDWACDMGAFEMQFTDNDTVSKTVSAGNTYTFGPTLVRVEVVDDGGCLTNLSIQRVESDHPNATIGIQTGRYWTITPIGCSSSFTTTVTLPYDILSSTNDKACRYTGSGWDCGEAVDTSIETTGPAVMSNIVVRSEVSEFSDWAVGGSVGPTTVSLHSFSATSDKTAVWLVLLSLIVMMGGMAGFFVMNSATIVTQPTKQVLLQIIDMIFRLGR